VHLSSIFLSVFGICSHIHHHHLLGGPLSTFFALMVGASRSLAPPPSRPFINVPQQSGSHSQTSSNASQGTTMSRTYFFFQALALPRMWRDNCHAKRSRLPSGALKNWPQLGVHILSRGGPGGHCQYPVERVPLHTSFKPRQGEGVHLCTAMCPAAPYPTSLPRRALALPCVPWL
jgi:hypothetical protein